MHGPVEKNPLHWRQAQLPTKMILSAVPPESKQASKHLWRRILELEENMNLTYAVDRLYEIGWLPSQADAADLERLDDGRRYPSIAAVQRQFAQAGLKLVVKPNLMFNCHQAAWCPAGEQLDPSGAADERHGTVIGACPREAAVYALAQLLAAQTELQTATA
jgi:hypothetical protein